MTTAAPALVAAGCSSENIYWYQEQNCGKKNSPSQCRDCCEFYCRPYHEDHCEEEFDSCVDDVSTCIQRGHERVCIFFPGKYKRLSGLTVVFSFESHYSFIAFLHTCSATKMVIAKMPEKTKGAMMMAIVSMTISGLLKSVNADGSRALVGARTAAKKCAKNTTTNMTVRNSLILA